MIADFKEDGTATVSFQSNTHAVLQGPRSFFFRGINQPIQTITAFRTNLRGLSPQQLGALYKAADKARGGKNPDKRYGALVKAIEDEQKRREEEEKRKKKKDPKNGVTQ